jgi:MerR family redox-sensitive transcriptional activator SoxR
MTQGSGCTPRTVRYYERQGLLTASRSPGGHRLFPPSELERLNFIISLREAGWSLEEITSLFNIRELADGDQIACTQLRTLVASHIGRLQQKIAILTSLHVDLQETQRLLSVCTECTDDGPQDCGACERVPARPDQPRGFKLSWRAGEIKARASNLSDESSPRSLNDDDPVPAT